MLAAERQDWICGSGYPGDGSGVRQSDRCRIRERDRRIAALEAENERLRFWLKHKAARQFKSNAYHDVLTHIADNEGYQSINGDWPHFRFPLPENLRDDA